MSHADRLSAPIGEIMYSMRAIRRLKPDPVAIEDIVTILDAARQAPSGSNRQPWHFLVVRDAEQRAKLGAIYREAWWAKRRDEGFHKPEDFDPNDKVRMSAMRLADHFGEPPVIILMCAMSGAMVDTTGVIPATQNLLLAARALGLGATITSLHPDVQGEVRELFGMPEGVQVVYAVPVGYPQGNFGPVSRKPLSEVASLDRWGEPLPGA